MLPSRFPLISALLLFATAQSACDLDSQRAAPLDSGSAIKDTSPALDTGSPKTVFGGTRPVNLEVPTVYDGTKPLPLVIVLHGYGATGTVQMKYLGYHNLVEKEGVFMAAPIGMVDSNKKNYWDATDACCDFAKTKPGDSSYLSKLIEEIKGSYKIDPKRVYLIGHSNGGYMSYRMACDHADQIAAIVSLAGATWSDTTKCVPKDKVSVLQIHGDKDSSVKYAGGSFGAGAITYPGAVKTAKIWATYNGCHAATTTSAKALDLDLMVAGAETQMMKHKGCPAGIGVELWTIKGGGHLPIPTPSFASETWAFFKAHPKP